MVIAFKVYDPQLIILLFKSLGYFPHIGGVPPFELSEALNNTANSERNDLTQGRRGSHGSTTSDRWTDSEPEFDRQNGDSTEDVGTPEESTIFYCFKIDSVQWVWFPIFCLF
jgi:hypothetical protein